MIKKEEPMKTENVENCACRQCGDRFKPVEIGCKIYSSKCLACRWDDHVVMDDEAEGQDRRSYSDDQDRTSYTVDAL